MNNTLAAWDSPAVQRAIARDNTKREQQEDERASRVQWLADQVSQAIQRGDVSDPAHFAPRMGRNGTPSVADVIHDGLDYGDLLERAMQVLVLASHGFDCAGEARAVLKEAVRNYSQSEADYL